MFTFNQKSSFQPNDSEWITSINHMSQLLQMEIDAFKARAGAVAKLNVSCDVRAAVVEKLFRAGKDLDKKHTFNAICLLDHYLE